MEIMTNINRKLDIGWKLTNLSCPKCKGTTMAEPRPDLSEIYCPKCNRNYSLTEIQENASASENAKNQLDMEDQEEYISYSPQSYQTANRAAPSTLKTQSQNYSRQEEDYSVPSTINKALQKTNDTSKKIGEKLLHGWTMLNESCPDCLAPLMKSKKGEKICFGCDKDYAEIERLQKAKSEIVNTVKETDKSVKQKSSQVSKTVDVPASVVSSPPQDDSIFSRIESKSLAFLQKKLDRSIEENDFTQVQRILALVYKIKHEFK